MIEESVIPSGWLVSTGGEIFKWSSGKNLPKEKQIIGDFPVYGGNGIAGTHSEYLSETPTLVIGRVGANCGNVFTTEGKSWITDNAIFATTIPKELNLEYLRLAFHIADLNSIAGGSGQPFINQQTLNNLTLLIPPLAEQTRIVTAIESLQERSSRTRALLAEVKPLIAQLRQSVLRSAFSGRLTADWRAKQDTLLTNKTATEQAAPPAGGAGKKGQRAQQPEADTNGSPQSIDTKFQTATELLQRIRTERRQRWETAQLAAFEAKGKAPTKGWRDKYKEPEPVDDSELPGLPEGWCWCALEEITDKITDGTHQSPAFTKAGVPFLVIRNVISGEIDWDGVDKWVSEETYIENTKHSRPDMGDVLYTAVGSYGVAVAVQVEKEFMFQRHIAHFKPVLKGQFSNFIAAALNSDHCKKQADSVARGVAQKTVTLGHLRRFSIPLAPLGEQKVLLKLLEESHGVMGNMSRKCEEVQSSLIQLDQSILSKAFRGELLPQDPNDEPASELLARIRATREATAAKKKPSKKKASTKKSKKNSSGSEN